MAAPPMMVSGKTYLLKMLSRTLSSFLKPGICKPEFIMLRATLEASMPAVLTQKIENTIDNAT